MRRSRSSLKPSIRQLAIGVVAFVLGLALTGCQVPLPSSQRGTIPSPFPGAPGGTPQIPTSSLPSPIPSPPSLPSPTSSPIPSPSSSLPSPSLPLPSASRPSTGGGDGGGSPSVRPPTGSGPEQRGSQGGLEPPTGGDNDSETGNPDNGWEVSNEGGDDIGGPERGAGESVVTDPDGGERESQVDALERALEELDGEILDDRVTTVASQPRSRRGSAAEGSTIPAPPAAEPTGTQPPLPLPPDQPDARDDDVVARQIREAAMAETDPELREQLWEEYRRYKSGL